MATDPLYLDVQLPAGAAIALPVPVGHHAFVYPFEGEIVIAGERIRQHSAAVLADGDSVHVTAGAAGCAPRADRRASGCLTTGDAHQ